MAYRLGVGPVGHGRGWQPAPKDATVWCAEKSALVKMMNGKNTSTDSPRLSPDYDSGIASETAPLNHSAQTETLFSLVHSMVLGDVECDGVPSYGVGSNEDLGYRSYEKGYQKRCKGEPVGSNCPPQPIRDLCDFFQVRIKHAFLDPGGQSIFLCRVLQNKSPRLRARRKPCSNRQ